MESIVLNLLVSVSGIIVSAAGTAWRIQRHFDERIDALKLEMIVANGNNLVDKTKTDGELALLRIAIEGAIERTDHKTAVLSRDLRSIQNWLAKHHRYNHRQGEGDHVD